MLRLNSVRQICSSDHPIHQQCQTNKALFFIFFVTSSISNGRTGILTSCPSAAAFAIALGPPNPPLIAIAEETLDLRESDFSSNLWLLMPTFSLLSAPPALTGQASTHLKCSPTAVSPKLVFDKTTRVFGNPDALARSGSDFYVGFA